MGLFDLFRPAGHAPANRNETKPGISEQEASRLIEEGNILEDANRLEEAMQHYDAALLIAPNFARAHLNRGNILLALDKTEDALKAFTSALTLNPNYAAAHYNTGNAHARVGKHETALAAYREAIRLKPDFVDAEVALGCALEELGRFEDAAESYRHALEIKPDYAEVHGNLGKVLHHLGQFHDAAASYRRALEINPLSAPALTSLGDALRELGKINDAATNYQQALQIDPDCAEAYSNLGLAQVELGQLDEALKNYRQALRIKPDDPDIHGSLGVVLLVMGQLPEAWREYEFRWKGTKPPSCPPTSLPQWTGQLPPTGDRLLVFVEQGLGDMLQFSRYLLLAAERFPDGVSILVGSPMLTLFRLSFPMVEVLDALPADQSAWQWQCPLLSLPLAFDTTLETIPRRVPYLIPDQARVAHWQNKITSLGLPASTRKIGIAWKSGTGMRIAQLKSMTLQVFAPLLNHPNCTWFSLQKEPDPDMAPWIASGKLIDWANEFSDFNETASLAMNLDLVISVDTSVVHLAGGLGLPTWLFNRHASDWRWMRNREDSPWYPTMRIFTQTNAGDWDEVVKRIFAALANLPTAARLLCKTE